LQYIKEVETLAKKLKKEIEKEIKKRKSEPLTIKLLTLLSAFFLLLLFLLLLSPSPANTHQVVFEEIGEIAGALSLHPCHYPSQHLWAEHCHLGFPASPHKIQAV
jgi:hypothetical protein